MRISFVVCLAGLSIIFVVIYTSLLWSTLRNGAIASIDPTVDRLHFFVLKHLRSSIQPALSEVQLVMNCWSAQEDLSDTPNEANGRFAFRVLNRTTMISGLTLTKTNGETAGGVRSGATVFELTRDGEDPNSTTPYSSVENRLYRLDANFNRIEPPQTANIDPRTRQWYKDAINAGQAVFTMPFFGALVQSSYIAYSMPIPALGPPEAVLSVALPFNVIGSALESTRLGLVDGIGMVFILDTNHQLLAASSSRHSTAIAADVAEVQREVPENPTTSFQLIKKPVLSSFGRSFVLKMTLTDTSKGLDVPAVNVQWTLVLVVPENSYYARINSDTNLVVIDVVVIVVVFLVALVVMPIVLITLPLRNVARHLAAMVLRLRRGSTVRESLSFEQQSAPSDTTNNMDLSARFSASSCLLELDSLYQPMMGIDVQIDALAVSAPRNVVSEGQPQNFGAGSDEQFSGISPHLSNGEEELHKRTLVQIKNLVASCLLSTLSLKAELPEDAKEAALAASIHTQQAVQTLVNGLLDCKAQKQQTLEPGKTETFDVRECINEVTSWAHSYADQKDVHFEVVIPPKMPTTRLGDRIRFVEMLFPFVLYGIDCNRSIANGMPSVLCCTYEDPGVYHFKMDGVVQADQLSAAELGPTSEDVVQTIAFQNLRVSKRLAEHFGGQLEISSNNNRNGQFVFSLAIPFSASEP